MGTRESTHVHFWHEYEKFHICRFWCNFTGTSFRMYISYNDPKRCTKETFLKGSAVYVNLFSVLGSTTSGTIDINLWSSVLNRHNLRQSQIATSQELLPSQFCDLSQFVTKTVPWQIQSNNIENVFCVFRTQVQFWQESERLSIDPFSC